MKRASGEYRLIGLLLLVAGAAGCASPGAYFHDRWNDAKDVLTVDVGNGAGARARVGPVHAGLIGGFNSCGLRNGELGVSESLDLELLVFPMWFLDMEDSFVFSAEGAVGGQERGKNYAAVSRVPFVTTKLGRMTHLDGLQFDGGGNPAYYSQIEVTAGVGLTLRLGFNPGELFDFLLGWTTLDIYGDDLEARREREEAKKAKEKPPEVPSTPQAPPPPQR